MNSIQDVHYCLYELHSETLLSSRGSRKTRHGALLRIQFKDGIGFADCHPWLELGDLSVEKQLKLLSEGKLTSLSRKSLHFARQDAEGRKEEKSLFTTIRVPPSHLLVTDLTHWGIDRLHKASEDGFSFIKIKVGRDLEQEIPLIKQILSECPTLGMKLRLDFNASLTQQSFEYFLTSISKGIDFIDFIEDPFPFHPVSWAQVQKAFPCSLACDHQSERAVGLPLSAKVIIVKPALQDEMRFKTDLQRVIYTTYLDHPIGQLAAAYSAAKMETRETGGFLSHFVYDQDPFMQELHTQGPQLIPPKGTGFGFDDILKQMNWNELKAVT